MRVMNEKTLRVLEFDRIIQRLSSFAVSKMGKELVDNLSPVTEPDKVRNAIKETDEASGIIVRKGNPPLSGIRDIRGSIKRMEIGAILNAAELLGVADVLKAGRNLQNYIGQDSGNDNFNITGSKVDLLVVNRKLEDRIYSAIISEEEMDDNASPALATIRRQIRDAENSIKDRLNDIIHSSKYQKYLQDSVVTIRGDRYVVPVKAENRPDFPGLVHDSSASGATLFIEPMAVVEANNNIKQLKIKAQLEIERILAELTAEAARMVNELKCNLILLTKLDFIFAKGKLSLEYNCVSPRIKDDGNLIIKKGRHPLLDPKTVVPIDVWLGGEFDTLLVTGPNTGGKTVTLKTVGLFILMAQAGLHVPASDGTELCIFKKVFADIGDEQSIEQSLSTFSSHMTNIVKILEQVDEHSLVMFDELGAGTDPTEGAALAMSILEYLHGMGVRTVATTHYSELKVFAISTPGVENACCEFDVETLKPTYRLLIGIPGKSNAFAISKRLGLQEYMINRAKEFISHETVRFEDIISDIEQNRRKMEEDQIKAAQYRIEIETLKKELEEQKFKLDGQKEKVLREARVEARRVLSNAKHESEAVIEDLRKLLREEEEAGRNRAIEEARAHLRKNISEIESAMVEPLFERQGYVEPPRNLKPGDSVQIINLNQKGTVLSPPDSNGEALIQAGIMKINVQAANLRLIDDVKPQPSRTGAGKVGASKTRTISVEIDLRGQALNDAIENVDKYLDDAALSGLKEVTLIHGKGTGVLRSGIQQFLKKHSHVKSFRLGKYGEGESGVTVVELK